MTHIENSYTVVSRHVTSEGVLVYLRSPDGGVEVRLHRWDGGDSVVAAGAPAPARCA